MTTLVDLCNVALLRIDQDPITNIAEKTIQAQKVNAIVDLIRRKLLSSYCWNFAIRKAQLLGYTVKPNPDTPIVQPFADPPEDQLAFDYAFMFQKPPKMLLLRSVFDTFNNVLLTIPDRKAPWKLDGDYICADIASISIRYIADVEDVNKWPVYFQRLFSLSLAAELSKFFTDSLPLFQIIRQELQIETFEAQGLDASQTRSDDISYQKSYTFKQFK